MKIAFIGGGNMASALIGGLIARGHAASDLTVVDVLAEARERTVREFGVRAGTEVAAAVAAANAVVLAVKPQQMLECARSLQPALKSQLVISIAAGIRGEDLSRWLGGYRRIVRVMPNTPALVRSGFAGLHAMNGVDADDRRAAQDILGAVGATLWLDDEAALDAVTGLSGSGPAYVFYFIEAMQQAARELGFSAGDARTLSLATFAGAVKLAEGSSEDAATLRARVTSKGGTTEAALACMDADQVKQAIVRAIHAATRRSAELGDQLGKQG